MWKARWLPLQVEHTQVEVVEAQLKMVLLHLPKVSGQDL
jgi:hypothetical protein